MDDKYLKLLAKEFPNKQAVLMELINLKAILRLPKGTEHFVSDLHGEYEAFQHILKNASGRIKEKIEVLFAETKTSDERKALAVLIYYPEEMMTKIESELSDEALAEWYLDQLSSLVILLKDVSAKYTRSKVRKGIAPDFRYIIEELLFTSEQQQAGSNYYEEIFQTIVDLAGAKAFIVEMSQLIQQLTVDHLHVVGDIYDRGPEPDKIMEALLDYHSLDIQWGNHDTLWMGAGFGSEVCQANVIRICARYNNLDIIEDAYGMSLRFLVDFAKKHYPNPPLTFYPNAKETSDLSKEGQLELASIQQGMAMIQFKLEGQLIETHPSLNMVDRNHLAALTFDQLCYHHDLGAFPLEEKDFVTVSPSNPNDLTQEEEAVVEKLNHLFLTSEKLQKHLGFLVEKGGMHLVYNDNLLYHGCIPMDKTGAFQQVSVLGQKVSGKSLLEFFDQVVRRAYNHVRTGQPALSEDLVMLWYLWTGKGSPLFGKDKMTTFERYYLNDPQTHIEEKNPYYDLREEQGVCQNILAEFGIHGSRSVIVNGHTPVKEKRGETPIKGGGKLLVIDGGFSKPYQSKTGIAGYTLLFNSYGMTLAVHHPFCGPEQVVAQHRELISHSRKVFSVQDRLLVQDTDIGAALEEQVNELMSLLEAFENRRISEKHSN